MNDYIGPNAGVALQSTVAQWCGREVEVIEVRKIRRADRSVGYLLVALSPRDPDFRHGLKEVDTLQVAADLAVRWTKQLVHQGR